MDTILIIILLLANFLAVAFLIKRKQPEPVNNEQIFKDELSSLKNTFSQSFGSMSKEIAKDMTGALTKVDEKVSVFNQQVSELNKSQDNFSRILSGVGFVPKVNIVGKVWFIWFSVDTDFSLSKFWNLPLHIRYDRLFNIIK